MVVWRKYYVKYCKKEILYPRSGLNQAGYRCPRTSRCASWLRTHITPVEARISNLLGPHAYVFRQALLPKIMADDDIGISRWSVA